MKNIYLKITLLSVLAFTTFTSCETEPVDPYISGINDPDLNVSTVDYFPRQLNNEWIYKTNGVFDAIPTRISGNTTIEGAAWFNITGNLYLPQGATATSYIRKVETDYYLRFDDIVQGNTTQTAFEILFFKDDAVQNETWTQLYQNEISYLHLNINDVVQRIRVENRVISKDIAVTINGVRYSEVTNVESKFYNSSNNTYLYTFNTWFAKEIGVVRQVYTNDDNVTVTKVLDSYLIN